MAKESLTAEKVHEWMSLGRGILADCQEAGMSENDTCEFLAGLSFASAVNIHDGNEDTAFRRVVCILSNIEASKSQVIQVLSGPSNTGSRY